MISTQVTSLSDLTKEIFDSSEESMGEWRFGQFSKWMIQGHFGDSEGPEAVGFSHSDFDLVIQSLDNAAGELFFGPKVVENQGSVGAQHLYDFFQGFDSGEHRLVTPHV
jgi:hypothetical protein